MLAHSEVHAATGQRPCEHLAQPQRPSGDRTRRDHAHTLVRTRVIMCTHRRAPRAGTPTDVLREEPRGRRYLDPQWARTSVAMSPAGSSPVLCRSRANFRTGGEAPNMARRGGTRMKEREPSR
jgi:hypothetical protein